MNKVTIGDCTLYHGACEDILPTLEAESAHAVISVLTY